MFNSNTKGIHIKSKKSLLTDNFRAVDDGSRQWQHPFDGIKSKSKNVIQNYIIMWFHITFP